MWQYNYTDELFHYGVLGMKWGVRKEYKPVGKGYSANRIRYGARGARRIDRRMARGMSSQQARRRENIRRLGTAAAIGLGGAMAVSMVVNPRARTAAVRKAGKALMYAKRAKAGSGVYKKSLSKGANWLKKKGYNVGYKAAVAHRKNINRAKGVARTVKRVTKPARRVIKNNPAMRTVRNVKKSVGKTNAGKYALRGLAAATLASDINSTQQWVREQKKKGKVTRKDVGRLAKDLVNPIPNNIPVINKNAREKRKKKKTNSR